MFAKRFFFVCAGILCLTLAYHFGATSATAQAPGNPVVTMSGGIVVTANGDVYSSGNPSVSSEPFRFVQNVFGSGGPVPTSQPTWGQLKARYRGEQGAAPEGR